MSKLLEVQKKLLSINDAVFQNICDSFLYHTQDNFPDITRVGSTTAKQKTSKGTPDTYFLLPNGRYIFVEYTTRDQSQSKNTFLKKVQDDISKCLDVKRTGVELKNIEKIILCYNSKLLPKDLESLKKVCREKEVNIEFKGIDTIGFALIGRCKHVAKEYLGISIDTGQILNAKVFIEEYENSGFATPLSNKLYGRLNELKILTESIKANQITIVSGAPGVGKSRLVLEALSEIQLSNKKLSVFCMSNKSAPIYEDLRTYLSEDKPYVIFIDDGNRQSDNLQSLLALIKEKRKNPIHIVITVRDYALNGIKQACVNYKVAEYELLKLGDEQIQDILKGDDFNIQNSEYLIRICDIAKGNPRLAIMAARVAVDTQDIQSLNDVYDLYEQYFESAVSDRELLTNKTLLKTLGILSFFYSINIENSDFIKKICADFSLTESDVKEALIKFEEWELAESTPDNSVVRISDQVLSTYFFYKIFLKDRILDFQVLLENYFADFNSRFNDTVIAANSTFGYENVLGTVDIHLSNYWQAISDNYSQAVQFLKLFWLYRHEDLYSFVDSINNSKPEVLNPQFIYSEDNKNRSFLDKNEVLSLLCNCFEYIQFDYIEAVDLAFEYVKRNPASFQQLQEAIIQHFQISVSDLAKECERQKTLFEFLTNNISKSNIYQSSLLLTLPTFLQKNYRNYSRNNINLKSTPIKEKIIVIDAIKDFRETVWSFVNLNYKQYKNVFDDIILAYIDKHREGIRKVYEFDYAYLEKIFKGHFQKAVLSDVFIIQSLLFRLKKLGLNIAGMSSLRTKYKTKAYETYLALSYNRIRDKEEHEFEIAEYDQLKEDQIRKGFQFKTVNDFKKLYKIYVDICALKDRSYNRVSQSLDIIIHNHAVDNPQLALSFLKLIVNSGNETNFVPVRIVNVFFSSQSNIHKEYFDIIRSSAFNSKDWWLCIYYSKLPFEEINESYYIGLLELLETTTSSFYIDLKDFKEYKKFQSDFYIDALTSIIKNKEQNNTRLYILPTIFDELIEEFGFRVDLLKSAYLLMDMDRDHFDYNCKYLLAITEKDSGFFLEYIKSVANENQHWFSREFDNLSIIWQLPNAEMLVEQALDHYIKVEQYYISDCFANSFFKNIDIEERLRAFDFLKSYLKKHIKNSKAVNAIFDCVRNSLNEFWNEIIVYFLAIETDLAKFQEIELLNNSFSSNGDQIWADVRAEELQTILDAIDQIPVKKYKYSKHKSYIKEQIQMEKRYADYERKLKFQRKYWH